MVGKLLKLDMDHFLSVKEVVESFLAVVKILSDSGQGGQEEVILAAFDNTFFIGSLFHHSSPK